MGRRAVPVKGLYMEVIGKDGNLYQGKFLSGTAFSESSEYNFVLILLAVGEGESCYRTIPD